MQCRKRRRMLVAEKQFFRRFFIFFVFISRLSKKSSSICIGSLDTKEFSSGLGSVFGLTPGQHRRKRETETKGKGAEECGSNLMR
jgi:hypothetical protein